MKSFLQQAKELDLGAEILSIESPEFETDEVSLKLMEGMWYVAPADVCRSFADSYHEKYNVEPGMATGNIYDAIMLIVEAAEKYGPDRDSIRVGLENIKEFSGALGSYSSGPEGIFQVPAAVKMVKNGKFIFVE